MASALRAFPDLPKSPELRYPQHRTATKGSNPVPHPNSSTQPRLGEAFLPFGVALHGFLGRMFAVGRSQVQE